MKLAQVWIEHASLKLDQTYSYLCHDDALQAGMRVLINFNGKNIVGFVESVEDVFEKEKTPTFNTWTTNASVNIV